MTATHRKKPLEVEARRFVRDPLGWTNAHDLAAWCGGTVRNALAVPTDLGSLQPYVDIRTREGTMTADVGDWVIREPNPTDDRKFYPVKPEIFAATYDEIETEEQA